jgi:hypothetical protein
LCSLITHNVPSRYELFTVSIIYHLRPLAYGLWLTEVFVGMLATKMLVGVDEQEGTGQLSPCAEDVGEEGAAHHNLSQKRKKKHV